MREVQNLEVRDLDDLAGAFVETAFSAEQVARALLEESRGGVRENECAFLFSVKVNVAQA